MKKIRLLVYQLTLLSLVSINLISCDNQKNNQLSTRQKDDQVEVFEKNIGNKRKYNEAYFNNPNNIYRMLPVNHKSALSSGGASISTFENYMKDGYGGVVTNVAFGDKYLKSEQNWSYMEEAITEGIEKLGMRVMLYDENYYPSGGARQNTLANTPEGENWEAQGLVHQEQLLKAGVSVTLKQLHGHKMIHAFVYSGSSINDIDMSSCQDVIDLVGSNGEYTPSNNGIMIMIYQKNFYEGTHFQNNLMESRRYIDIMNSNTIKEFIRNTYESYYSHFSKYFGHGIESFFFDEPSFPGFYFSPTNATVIDPVDSEIEQYPSVNYSNVLQEKFIEKYGYDMNKYLPYLFEKSNTNENVRRFRWQYYQLIGELFANNFCGQLNDWSSEHNVVSSGHLLEEEDISAHPLLAGNYMENYRNMGMPGIDCTYGQAKKAIEIGANVAKQATSIADFRGLQHSFCEVGQDASDGLGANIYDNIANVAVLQSMGIDYLVSYFRIVNDEENQLLANTSARINYMLDGNVSDKEVAVYYPIESIYIDSTPYNANGQRIYTGQWGFNSYVSAISTNYRSLCQSMVKNQIDYNIFDSVSLENSIIENGKLVTPNGESYSTIVVPTSTAMCFSALNKLKEASDAGVNVIIQNANQYLVEDKEKQNTANDMLNSIKNNKNTTEIHGESSIVINKMINDFPNTKLVNFTMPNNNIVARKQTNVDTTLYMLVNTAPSSQTVTLIADEVGEEYRSWNPYTGEVGGLCVRTSDTKSYITLTLPAYNVALITIK